MSSHTNGTELGGFRGKAAAEDHHVVLDRLDIDRNEQEGW
jgi:hypothetical protein